MIPAIEASGELTPTRVDMAFPLVGTTLPLDHGYSLFGALCRVLGDLHGASWLSVHPVVGEAVGDTELGLFSGEGGRRSHLVLRVEPVRIPAILGLSGKLLELDGHGVRVGVPNIYPITPSSSLWARLVVIKGFLDEKPFEEAVKRQLEACQIKADVELGRRRVIRIRDSRVVGFGVKLSGLSDGHSVQIQARGLGGRQHFGCGVLERLPAVAKA